jgi:hypothetical protein
MQNRRQEKTRKKVTDMRVHARFSSHAIASGGVASEGSSGFAFSSLPTAGSPMWTIESDRLLGAETRTN